MLSPKGNKRFQPGILLSVFTLFFLPVFVVLGFWQLNRAVEKDQLLALASTEALAVELIEWNNPPLYRSFVTTGELINDTVFLLDNKTHNGQFGYEVFKLLKLPTGSLVVSLGWVAGSADRNRLPELSFPSVLTEQEFTIRSAPTNPLFGVDTNLKHPAATNTWVVQSLSSQWLTAITGEDILAFVQADNADEVGVGLVIWQPTVLSPLAHRGYALQWFSMAAALSAMFVFAGLKRSRTS